MRTLTHGALFNGIGGFCLSASWAGIPTHWTVEIDEFCNKVSKKHFPDAIQYTDIRTVKHLPYVDVLSAGFPCQPYSVAGKQLGEADDRALWPQVIRLVRAIKPTYVIGENVTGLISLALDQVLADLEGEDYTTETFVLPAASVGAPHRRDRVWIVAYSNSKSESTCSIDTKKRQRVLANTNQLNGNLSGFLPGKLSLVETSAVQFDSTTNADRQSLAVGNWRTGAGGTFTPITGSDWWATEPNVGRVANGVPARMDRLKSLGNAIVPALAYELFQAIQKHANEIQFQT